MMKRLTIKQYYNITIVLCSLLFLFVVNPSLALTKTTPTVAPTSTKQTPPSVTQDPALVNKMDQQINTLKEKIASRVAQLNLVEKKGIIGTFVEASGTEMQVNDIQNNIRYIDVDELTKFSSPSAKTFGISDIQKGTVVGILGNYNKESKRILARFVDVLTLPVTVTGTVTAIDRKNYTFTLTTSDGNLPAGRQENKLIDIQDSTKTFTYTKDGGLKKSGFSKVSENTSVYVIGYQSTSDSNKIEASRVIMFLDLSGQTVSGTPAVTSEVSPTLIIPTKSGIKSVVTPTITTSKKR